MNSLSFLDQARQNTIDFFYAYCHANDMERALSYFSQTSSFISWGKNEVYLDYAAVAATLHERMTMPYFLELSNVHTEIINATENFCVVLFTANINYHTDKDTAINEFVRATAVFRKEQEFAKIVYLHCSASNMLHSLGRIIPLEHGVEATKQLTKLECDRSMAIDICNHTPNGLAYFLIGDRYPFVYANQTFCEIMGCEDFADLMLHTKGELECTIYKEDVPMVRQALLSHVNGESYTINYRVVTKQGYFKWVMERGQYISDTDTGEEYYICTVIPLELEQDEFSYGNLVDYSYIQNAKISVELFLQQTLDYNDFHNRPASCKRLLEHCCNTLQASGGVISAIKDRSQKLELLYYYDVNNVPSSNVFDYFTWGQLEEFFTEDGFSICSDLNNVPESSSEDINWRHLRSTMTKIITIKGQPRYLLSVFSRHNVHHWTENEQDILEQASKLYSLLLDEEF